MKTAEINKIMEEFDSIETILPSDNWDFVFQNKLDNARLSKSNAITKFNLLMLVLVLVNIGFILNTFKSENTKTFEDKGAKYQNIADEFLTTSNN